MNEVWAPAVAGILAGLGVAMPLGAIAAIVLREGVVNGFRVSAASATGVATVDLLYCMLAMTLGTLVAPHVHQHRGIFLILSGALVVAMGARQLRYGLRRHPPAGPAAQVQGTSARAAYLRLVALTAVNPMTLLYFVALSSVVAAPESSWIASVVFVVAVGVSSLAWQLGLAAAGSVLGGSLGDRARPRIDVAASVIVLALGLGVMFKGIQAITGSPT